jgi:hypothetical protein
MTTGRLSSASLVLLLAFAAGCHGETTVTCESSADCLQGGIPGSCRPSPSSGSSFCSFSDPSCPSPISERWGVASGDGLARLCVTEDIFDAGPVSADGGQPDAQLGVDYFRRLGGSGSDIVSALARSGDGSVFVMGAFNGTTDLGTGPLTSAGALDGFVVRLSASGSVLWARRFGAESADTVASGAVDGEGFLVFGGTFTGSVNFGCGPKSASEKSSFLVKMSASGECVWSQVFGDGLVDLALDDAGDVYVVGSFAGSGLFGGTLLRSTGSTDVFMSRFAGSTGAGVWSERWGGTGSEDAKAIAVRADQLAIVADVYGDTDFGGTPFSSPASAVVIAKYATATGAHVWSKETAVATSILTPSHIYDVALDAHGNAFALGTFGGATDLGAGAVMPVALDDAFVAKLGSTTGACLWAQALGGDGVERGDALATLPADRVAVVGAFTQRARFGTFSLSSAGDFDGFLVTLSSLGTPEAAVSWGSTGVDGAVAIVGGDFPVVAGTFSASVDFGDFGGVATSSGGSDVFVVRHALP